jgi:putative addiction module killer protein
MGYVIKQTETFAKWLLSIKDLRAQLAVARRIERASAGNFGDIKSVGEGVSEMRIDMGAGYRCLLHCSPT